MLRALVAAALIVAAGPALGSQRQFVASYGNDANPCTLAQPCRSFGVAATAVDPNGELIVLDSAGYGPVAITKSLSLVSPAGIYAGISVAAGQNGITVNGPGINVRLDGLTVNGQGGSIGILVQQAARVTIERCIVTNMVNEGFSNAAVNARVLIKESEFNDNGGAGIFSGVPGSVTIDNAHADRNGASGIFFANATGTISNSVTNNNAMDGVSIVASPGIQTNVGITTHKSSANSGWGMSATQTGNGIVDVSVGQSVLSGNFQSGALASAAPGGTGIVAFNVSQSQISANQVAGLSAENAASFVIS